MLRHLHLAHQALWRTWVRSNGRHGGGIVQILCEQDVYRLTCRSCLRTTTWSAICFDQARPTRRMGFHGHRSVLPSPSSTCAPITECHCLSSNGKRVPGATPMPAPKLISGVVTNRDVSVSRQCWWGTAGQRRQGVRLELLRFDQSLVQRQSEIRPCATTLTAIFG